MTENSQVGFAGASNSFTGKTLTASQLDEVWAVTGIMEREIRKTGSFREKLTDYAHAFARSENFDQMKGETIVRDIFKSRYGQTMNQLREGLMEREATIGDARHEQALHHARSIPQMIQEGETMAFYRAYDTAAVGMAEQHGITESGAKSLMKDAFRQSDGRELYDVGKELEAKHHQPKREAERAARQSSRSQTPRRSQSRQP